VVVDCGLSPLLLEVNSTAKEAMIQNNIEVHLDHQSTAKSPHAQSRMEQ
jgi:hypothetical protein